MRRDYKVARAVFGGWLAVAALASCGTSERARLSSWTVSGAAPLDAAEGRVSVRLDAFDHHVVELVFAHLAPAKQAFVGTSYYMIWLVPKGGAPRGVGIITLNEARGAKVTISTAYEEFDVVVTAESFGNPSRPSEHLAFATRIPASV